MWGEGQRDKAKANSISNWPNSAVGEPSTYEGLSHVFLRAHTHIRHTSPLLCVTERGGVWTME